MKPIGGHHHLFRSGSAMVGTLITVAIILVLVVVFMRGGCGGANLMSPGKSPRADGKGTTTLGLAEARARDEVCRSNLSQVRQSLQVAEASDSEGHPASLQDLHLPDQSLHCPIGHEAYTYDPQTGQVHCPHPGHEGY
jgi:hypothetical protein